jgi:hypothetical protein
MLPTVSFSMGEGSASVRSFAWLLASVLFAPPLWSQPAAQPRIRLVDKPCPAGGIRVAVFADGKIRVDDKPVNVNEVSSTLRGLARSATEVCLHRENPDAPEPHPNMLKVLDAIVALKLPIAFYFDAAFQRRVALE